MNKKLLKDNKIENFIKLHFLWLLILIKIFYKQKHIFLKYIIHLIHSFNNLIIVSMIIYIY